jgi:predicted metal-dependent hydrolase
MSVKIVELEGVGEVSLHKRRGSRVIRISLRADGAVHVSLPSWVPYIAGIEFLKSKRQWIIDQRRVPVSLQSGRTVGHTHHLQFVGGSGMRVTTRVRKNIISVLLPEGLDYSDPSAQAAARRACLRVLRYEAETLLPKRLAALATQHGFTYRSVGVRQLKSRWGSCSSERDIVLNLFLMELPWELIDYVLLHELTHTRVMAHGKLFWDEMKKVLPQVQKCRRAMRVHQPIL